MILKKLILKDFLSFRDLEIEFNSSEFVLVKGENLTDPTANSNGSGKSAWVEGLLWGLTNQTMREISAIENRYVQNPECCAFVSFEYNNADYEIRRCKGKYLQLFENGKDISGKGIRDTQEIINEKFPILNTSFLSSIMILGQNMPYKFSSNKPSGRKEVLEKLTQTDFQIKDLKEKLQALTETKRGVYNFIDKELVKKETEVSFKTSQLEQFQDRLNSFTEDKELKEALKIKEEQLNLLNTQLGNLKEVTTVQLEELEKEREEWEDAKTNLSNEVQKLADEYYSKVNISNLAIQKLTLQKQEVDRWEKAEEIECPNCKHKFKSLEPLNLPNKEDLDKDIENLKDIAKVYKIEYEKATDGITAERNRLTSLIDSNFKLSSEKVLAVNELVSKVSSLTTSIMNIEFQLSNLEKNKTELKENISLLKSEIKEGEKRVKELTEELGKVQYDLQDLSKLVSYATKEFRGVLLTEIISILDEKAKRLCEIVFDTSEIEIKQSGNNIEISYLGKEVEGLSGGERQAVDVIVQLALRQVLLLLQQETSNVLICDEILDGLDQSRTNQIIELLNFLGIETVYFISHRAEELNISYDREMLIVKENNISRVER